MIYIKLSFYGMVIQKDFIKLIQKIFGTARSY